MRRRRPVPTSERPDPSEPTVSSSPTESNPSWWRHGLLAIFVVAVGLRFARVLADPPTAAEVLTPLSDSTDYDLLARQILAGLGWVGPEGDPTVIRPPLYPLFVALVYGVFGSGNLLAVALVQGVLGGVGSALTALVARRLGAPAWAGLAAGLVDAFYPVFVFQAGLILTEAPHRPLQMGAVLMTLRLAEDRRLWPAVACGVLWGLSALSRPVALVGMPAVVLWLGFIGRGDGWRVVLRSIAGVAVGAALLIGPWAGRNFVVSGRLIPVAANFPVTAVHGASTHSVHANRWFAPEELIDFREDRTILWHTQLRAFRGPAEELATQASYKKMWREYVAGNPATFAELTLRRVGQFWSPFIENKSRAARLAALISMSVMLVAGWLGFLVGIWSPRGTVAFRGAVLCLLVAASATLPHALSLPDVRYRTAHVDALWIALGAVALAWLVGLRRPPEPLPPARP